MYRRESVAGLIEQDTAYTCCLGIAFLSACVPAVEHNAQKRASCTAVLERLLRPLNHQVDQQIGGFAGLSCITEDSEV